MSDAHPRLVSQAFSSALRAMSPPAAAAYLAGVPRSEPIMRAGRYFVERVAVAHAAGVSTEAVASFLRVRGLGGMRLGTACLVPLRLAICYTMLQGERPPARWFDVEGESATEIAADLALQTEQELHAAAREARSPRNLFDADQVGRVLDFAVADRALEVQAQQPNRENSCSDAALEALARSHTSGATGTSSDRGQDPTTSR